MAGKIIFAVVNFIMAVTFTEIGIYAFLSKRPMHFWSGTKTELKNPSDIKKFNRANAFLWIFFGLPFLIFSALAFCFPLEYVGIALAIYILLGLFVLIFLRHRIEKKYHAANRL